MTFLDAVNRVLRYESILTGVDDDITSFADDQHSANISKCKISIQDQLADLLAHEVIEYEKASDVVTVSASTRLFDLAADFVQFLDERPVFDEVDLSDNFLNRRIFEYPGGEEALRRLDYLYQQNYGDPSYWYYAGTTSKQIGLYPVPNTTYTTSYYQYWYQKDVMVSVSSDTIPLVTETEAFSFVEMCARRFNYQYATKEIRDQMFPQGLARDPILNEARARLFNLIRPKRNTQGYGRRFF